MTRTVIQARDILYVYDKIIEKEPHAYVVRLTCKEVRNRNKGLEIQYYVQT